MQKNGFPQDKITEIRKDHTGEKNGYNIDISDTEFYIQSRGGGYSVLCYQNKELVSCGPEGATICKYTTGVVNNQPVYDDLRTKHSTFFHLRDLDNICENIAQEIQTGKINLQQFNKDRQKYELSKEAVKIVETKLQNYLSSDDQNIIKQALPLTYKIQDLVDKKNLEESSEVKLDSTKPGCKRTSENVVSNPAQVQAITKTLKEKLTQLIGKTLTHCKNKNGEKYTLFRTIEKGVKATNFVDENQIKIAAKNFIQLALQRDNWYSFGNETKSGQEILAFLNSTDGIPLKNALFSSPPTSKLITYNDLQKLVLSTTLEENKRAKFFSSSYKKETYDGYTRHFTTTKELFRQRLTSEVTLPKRGGSKKP